MKLRNKLFTGFAATVLALSMMVGTALAAEKLPAKYEEAAGGTVVDGQTSSNDVWVKIIGGGSLLYGDADIAHATRSVDITVTGNCSYDVEFIYNSDAAWLTKDQNPEYGLAGESVDGTKVYTFKMDGRGTTWCEAVLNLKNKTEGPLEVTKMEFKDEAGNIILTIPSAEEAAADDAPKTGVVSAALLLGVGAVASAIGTVVLKKKEK